MHAGRCAWAILALLAGLHFVAPTLATGVNQPPSVVITTPAPESRLARTVMLAWNASDPDGDALAFQILYKAPGATTFTRLGGLNASAGGNEFAFRYAIDTTRFSDGAYVLRVSSSDGQLESVADVNVSILNQASPTGEVKASPATAALGTVVLVTVEITKAQAVVELGISVGNNSVGRYPMRDDGQEGDLVENDGIYSTRVPVERAGENNVTIIVRYQEAGQMRETSLDHAASFHGIPTKAAEGSSNNSANGTIDPQPGAAASPPTSAGNTSASPRVAPTPAGSIPLVGFALMFALAIRRRASTPRR